MKKLLFSLVFAILVFAICKAFSESPNETKFSDIRVTGKDSTLILNEIVDVWTSHDWKMDPTSHDTLKIAVEWIESDGGFAESSIFGMVAKARSNQFVGATAVSLDKKSLSMLDKDRKKLFANVVARQLYHQVVAQTQ